MTVFTTPEPITATLTTAGAHVRIAASERPDTVVRVEPVNSASKSDVKVAEQTEVAFAGGELTIKTTKPGAKNGSVAITVELPAGSEVVLATAWTEVHADGRLGACELDVASGRVRLGHVAALRGRLSAGEVAVGHVTGTAELDGGSAGVRIGEVEGSLRYAGSTGKVWFGHARSDVEFAGSGGSFALDRADGSVFAEAAHCPIRIGRMTSRRADLTNAAGGIEVGVGEGSTASVDADSTKGAVRNSLPEHAGESADHVEIHARTRLGDIVIHRAEA
ncbi:hypothetical protein QRX60_33640 [Amycolatopsis mongoliensis]|uniref:Adhesin domain-containing protein n=1 Tax=Amycolatopsis mongoliensis TaxID=715475 RepID=A0A9Y2JHZ8_9PSEU|nr:hypothetical protein [Amycolatopsis sp. 4-36]WIX98975.1 hypothetical protein QRX60_33640 [Amycolatopsis sp. 4-36]